MHKIYPAKFLWAGILLWFDFLINPSFSLFTIMLTVIGLDFVTGIIKAKFKKEARTSQGYRKTVVKLMQYIFPVIILWAGSTFIPAKKDMLEQFSGWLVMFIIYIEVTSIFENLYEIDKDSMIGRYLYKYALVILKFGIEKNAVKKAAEKIDEQKEDEKPVS